jgi:hypothetical protein
MPRNNRQEILCVKVADIAVLAVPTKFGRLGGQTRATWGVPEGILHLLRADSIEPRTRKGG